MKIQHKIERFTSTEDIKFGLYFSDLTPKEYENLRCLILSILKYGQFQDNINRISYQNDLLKAFDGINIYDSQRVTNYEI